MVTQLHFISVSLSKIEILIYSAGSSGFLILIVSAVIMCVCFYQHKIKQISKQQTHLHTVRTESIKTTDVVEDSLYDSIDEDALYDDNIIIIYDREIVGVRTENDSDVEISSRKSEASGYLHPYTTVLESCETQAYCTLIKSVDSSSTSFVAVEMKTDSEYTHLYQQLQQERSPETKTEYSEINVHQYLELVGITGNANESEYFTKTGIDVYSEKNEQTCACNEDAREAYKNSHHGNISSITNERLSTGGHHVDLQFYSMQQLSSLSELTTEADNYEDNRNLLKFRHLSV